MVARRPRRPTTVDRVRRFHRRCAAGNAREGQVSVKVGSRFSWNALMPSRRSVRVRPHMLAGGSRASAASTLDRVRAVDGVLGFGVGEGRPQSPDHLSPRTRFRRVHGGDGPTAASSAGNRSASRAIFIARARPTTRPPTPTRAVGIADLVNAYRNAFSEHYEITSRPATPRRRRWDPAPPRRRAAVGHDRAPARLAWMRVSTGSSPSPVSFTPIPAPELKPRPVPPSRATRTRGSVAARSNASARPSSTRGGQRLRPSGRSMVTDKTPSARFTMRPSTGVSTSDPVSVIVMHTP